MPVALVEPLRTARPPPGKADGGGQTYDLRVGVAAKLGLSLATGALAAMPPSADNWTFRHSRQGCSLIDPTGTALALFDVPDDARWLAAAERNGKIVLIYGPTIGVRRPGHVPADQYDDNARATELDRSCAAGDVTWGTVRVTRDPAILGASADR
jgi:hypothetical protein